MFLVSNRDCIVCDIIRFIGDCVSLGFGENRYLEEYRSVRVLLEVTSLRNIEV